MPVIPKVIHRMVIFPGLRVKGVCHPFWRERREYDHYARDVEKACSPAEAHSAFPLIWQPVNPQTPPGPAMAPGPPGRKVGTPRPRGRKVGTPRPRGRPGGRRLRMKTPNPRPRRRDDGSRDRCARTGMEEIALYELKQETGRRASAASKKEMPRPPKQSGRSGPGSRAATGWGSVEWPPAQAVR
jgi:hypothetical protein